MTSRDQKGQTRDSNTLRAQYLEDSWRCYCILQQSQLPFCCEAVRSAILATAWLASCLRYRRHNRHIFPFAIKSVYVYYSIEHFN